MKNWQFLTDHYKFENPLAGMVITQKFGENALDFYKKWGMLGHNGLDLRAKSGTTAFACYDGEIVFAGKDGDGGISVRIRSNETLINGIKYRLEVIYYHLEECLVDVGDKVKAGDIVAKTDNTGKYTTGDHLHFGLKPEWNDGSGWKKDYSNGYFGAIDPEPFLYHIDFLPVDNRYGREFNWLAEFNMRFKNQWLHRKFYTELHRHPLSITDRELKALVYGSWDYETIFLHPEMWVIWTKQKKQDYLDKKPL